MLGKTRRIVTKTGAWSSKTTPVVCLPRAGSNHQTSDGPYSKDGVCFCNVACRIVQRRAAPSAAAPALALTKSHVGDFTVGQPGDYTLSVANTGDAPTSGPITIVRHAARGTDVRVGHRHVVGLLASGSSRDLHVERRHSAGLGRSQRRHQDHRHGDEPGTLINTATASGGGATNTATANDPTTIVASPPKLALTKSHTGNFAVGNSGFVHAYPEQHRPVGDEGHDHDHRYASRRSHLYFIDGAGWTCAPPAKPSPAPRHGGRAGSGGNPITLNVYVATAAYPARPIRRPRPAAVRPIPRSPTIRRASTATRLCANKSHTGNFVIGTTGTYTLSVNNTGNGPTSGTLTYTDTLPAGLTYVSAAGTGWSCSAAGQAVTCTTTTPIAAVATSPAIALP